MKQREIPTSPPIGQATSRTAAKVDEIEFLRGVAVVITFVGHLNVLFRIDRAAYPGAFDDLAFWGGVDLFFAISGYVIAKSLFENLSDATDTPGYWRAIGAFWIRRIFRIIPSAWIWLLIGLALTVGFNRSKAFGFLWPNLHDALAAVYQVFNLYYLACVEGKATCGPLFSVYWSLSLEEQFYLLFPFVLFLCPRRHLAKLLAVVVLSQFAIDRPMWSLWWAIRTDAICLGVLLALFSGTDTYVAMRPTALRQPFVRWIVVGLLLVGIVIAPQVFRVIPFSTGMLALFSAALVWVASYDDSYLIAGGRLRAFWVWVGSRSYALYLIHMPALLAVREIWSRAAATGLPGDHPGWEFGALAVVLLALLAEVNFRFVETPLRLRGRSLARVFLANGARSQR